MPDNHKRKSYFYIKDIATGKVVNKVEFDETNLVDIFKSDMQKVKDAFLEHLQQKYPSDKYQVIDQDKTIEERATHFGSGVFRMQASARSLLAVNIGGIIVGIFLLLLLLTVRHLYTLGLFIVGIIIIAIYMIIDYLIWKKRGIRIIEVDADGVTLYRGKEKRKERIDALQITDINIFKKINRKIVTIVLGGQVIKAMPGVTLFKGPRIRITNDSFNDKEFDVFIERIKQFKAY